MFEPSPRSIKQVQTEFDALAPFYDALPIAAHSALERIFAHRFFGRGGWALDVGCGTGRSAVELASHFDQVCGADLSMGMLSVAQRKVAAENVALQQMNAQQLAFRDAAFDFVLAHTVLHHLPDISIALKELRRVLRPGGHLVIVDILAEGVSGRCPVVGAYGLAALTSWSSLINDGMAAAHQSWSAATVIPWLVHQRGECFFKRKELERTCERELPGASMSQLTLEGGLTKFLEVVWKK